MISPDETGRYTLQINLSAGDAAYAESTVPALVRATQFVENTWSAG